MSYSSERKEEIIRQKTVKPCCRRALFLGALAAKGTASDGKITLRAGNAQIADFLTGLVREFSSHEPTLSRSSDGGRGVSLTFSSPAAERFLTEFSENTDTFVPKCEFCRGKFLSGIFLVSGSVCDPDKQYCLELSAGEKTKLLKTYLETQNLSPRYHTRREEEVLSLKNAEGVTDFLAMAGLSSAAFTVMNRKIETGIRADANRVSNSETSNIGKAVLASHKQLTVIEKLADCNLLSSLPPELEATAKLRLENPHLSLFQLAAITVPPVSRSGLSHRLSKIVAVGEEMLRARGVCVKRQNIKEK